MPRIITSVKHIDKYIWNINKTVYPQGGKVILECQNNLGTIGLLEYP